MAAPRQTIEGVGSGGAGSWGALGEAWSAYESSSLGLASALRGGGKVGKSGGEE